MSSPNALEQHGKRKTQILKIEMRCNGNRIVYFYRVAVKSSQIRPLNTYLKNP